MLKKIILGSIFIFSNLCLLQNHMETCMFAKRKLNNAISLYKDMSSNDQKFLLTHSMRQLAFWIIEKADFGVDSEFTAPTLGKGEEISVAKNTQRLQKIQTIEAKRSDFSVVQSKLYFNEEEKTRFLSKKMIEKLAKWNSEFETLNAKMSQVKEKIQKENEKYNNKLSLLESIVAGIKSENPSYEKDTEFISKLRSLKTIIEKIDDENIDFNWIFDEVEAAYGDNSTSPVKTKIQEYKVLLKNKDFLNSFINLEKCVQEKNPFTKNNTLTQDLKNINQQIKVYRDQLENKKEETLREIKGDIDTKLSTINLESFENYLEELENAKEIIRDREKLNKEYLELEKKLKRVQGQLETSVDYMSRWNEEEFEKSYEEFRNLDTYLSSCQPRSGGFHFKNPELKSAVTQYKSIRESFKYQNELTKVLQTNGVEFGEKMYFKVNNQTFDKQLGIVFAHLQGSGEQDGEFIRCFNPLELSVYFYYMGLLQIIYYMDDFLTAFFTNLPEEEKIIVVRQLFHDITSGPFVDNKMFDPQTGGFVQPKELNQETGEFAEHGLQRAIDNYAVLINAEIGSVLNLEYEQKSTSKKFISKVFQYAKIGGKGLLSAIENGSIGIFSKIVVITLFTVASLAIIPILVTALLPLLLAQLLKYLVDALIKKIENSPTLIYNINNAVAKVKQLLTEKSYETLDFETEFENAYQSDFNRRIESRQKDRKEKNRVKYFSQQFTNIETLVTIDVDDRRRIII